MFRGPVALAYVLLSVLITLSGRVAAQPLTASAINVKAATCGNNNGSFTVQASGGTPNYLYELGTGSNFGVDPNFGLLGPGTYTVTVQDAALTRYSFTVTIADERGPAITGVVTLDALCSGTDGIVTINTTGGVAPLQYSIDGGTTWQSSNVFNNVAEGNFTAVVQDANTCQSTSSGTIAKQCLQLIGVGGPAGCNNNDGRINSTASGGFPPYQYTIDNGANWRPTGIFSGLPAGDYVVNVVDNRGQASALPITIIQICLQATVTPGDATCGQNNGTIDIAATLGYEPYHYSIDGGTTFQLNSHFENLPPGPYAVVVEDAQTNRFSVNTTINASAGPTMNVAPTAATCANDDGVLEVTGAGGPGPYQYALDGGSYGSSGTFDHLPSGDHQVSVKDASGCDVTQTVTVPLNNTLTVTGGPDVNVCEGKTAVIPAASNGTSFSWQPAAGLDNAGILQPTVTATGNTTYTLTAKLGACQQTGTFNIIVVPAPIAIVQPGSNICSGGSFQLQGSGGGTYSWTPADHLDNPNAAEPIASGLTEAITYHLTVTDNTTGCQSQNANSVIISITPPPRVAALSDTIIQLGQSVTLHAIDVDNVGLGWQWNPSEGLNNDAVANPVASPQQDITYTVTGRTYNGCEAKASVTVKVFAASGIFMPNAFTPNGDGSNDILRPILLGQKELKYFAVFDRWGQRVYYSTNLSGGWRGKTATGQDQPAGTYVWMVGAVDDKGTLIQQKGTVILIR